ncbi:hypothetical protein ACJ2A9_15965 [Anaerobacillus sp. MEB173]|uniref:hypothetical protein n=1 Tax=Anaerobacillus sp. MEB173 TaxID=3383345 RepID=UPI003F93576A
MVTVCPKHVKDGINVLDLPHVTKLLNNHGQLNLSKCEFCGLSANYRLFDDLPLNQERQKKVKEYL